MKDSIGVSVMLPQQCVEKYFDEASRPSEVILGRWLNSGKVPDRKIGGSRYVDEHAWLANGAELV